MRKNTGFALLLAALLTASLAGCGDAAAPAETAAPSETAASERALPPDTAEVAIPAEPAENAPVPETAASPEDTTAPAETTTPETAPAPEPGAGPDQDPAPVESPAPSATPVPEATDAPDEPAGPFSEDVPDYTPLLDNVCDYLSRGAPWWEDMQPGLTGLYEMGSYLGADAANDLGYAIADLSGDGIPELALCTADADTDAGFRGSVVLSLYTWADGEPLLALEGWARNSYRWLGGGRFLNQGSSGAVYSILGTYALSTDGRELSCEECWFTWPVDEDWSEIGCWHNHLGAMEPELSEPWEGRDIWEIGAELEAQVQSLELTPLSGYLASWQNRQAEGARPLSAYWPDQVPQAYPDYLLCSLAGDGESAEVVFVAGETLTDFRLLELSMGEWDAEGTMRFKVQDRYTLDELAPGRPLIAKLAFIGDIPNNGVAFRDGAGTEHVYAVDLSGKDGSLVLWEIETEG